LQQKDPDSLMAQVSLARCRDQLGHAGEAVQLLESVLARYPGHPVALGELGKLALRQGRLAESERCLRQACELNPGDYRFQYQFYLCLKRLGKEEEAQQVNARLKHVEQDLKRLQQLVVLQMQQRPRDPELAYEMGMLALRSGISGEALRWFDKALADEPNHAATHEALARYYHQIGEIGRAMDHWNKAGRTEKLK
jgi:Flp pilus assembly protein TadD